MEEYILKNIFFHSSIKLGKTIWQSEKILTNPPHKIFITQNSDKTSKRKL